MFSSRLKCTPSTNRITRCIDDLKSSGITLTDITGTNPTTVGFEMDTAAVCHAVSHKAILEYAPDPRGMISARRAVADYYRCHGREIDPETVFLTASTSESYGFLFKLLCDPGDEVLIPRPSYPLFDFLADLESIRPEAYRMHCLPDSGWRIDMDHLQSLTTSRTRAVILVNPNNPTGSHVRPDEWAVLCNWCRKHGLALIVDEVFLDFVSIHHPAAQFTTAGNPAALTFTLSGISKVLGLPQLKLGWIQVSGPPSLCQTACRHLELIADTYLSVSTPVQTALSDLMTTREGFQRQVMNRIEINEAYLKSACDRLTAGRLLPREGGWAGILAMQNGLSDEDMVCRLLVDDHVLVHPGYFYDFDVDDCLVVSLLTRPDIFSEGINRLVSRFR